MVIFGGEYFAIILGVFSYFSDVARYLDIRGRRSKPKGIRRSPAIVEVRKNLKCNTALIFGGMSLVAIECRV